MEASDQSQQDTAIIAPERSRTVERKGNITLLEAGFARHLQDIAHTRGTIRSIKGPQEGYQKVITGVGLRLGERKFLFLDETTWEIN